MEEGPLGVLDIERVELSNGVTALLWPNQAEPGRVAVNVHWGAGIRAFDKDSAAYIPLGETALISSGLAGLDQEDLDRLATGRKFGFNFTVDLATSPSPPIPARRIWPTSSICSRPSWRSPSGTRGR